MKSIRNAGAAITTLAFLVTLSACSGTPEQASSQANGLGIWAEYQE